MKFISLLIFSLSNFVATVSFAKPAYLINNETTIVVPSRLETQVYQDGKSISYKDRQYNKVFCATNVNFDTVASARSIHRVNYSVVFEKAGLSIKTHKFDFMINGEDRTPMHFICVKENTDSLQIDSSEIQKAFGS